MEYLNEHLSSDTEETLTEICAWVSPLGFLDTWFWMKAESEELDICPKNPSAALKFII